MAIAGFGVQATPPPGTKLVAVAPPSTCVNGAKEIGDTYYPGIGNGGYDVTHYDLNLKYDVHTRLLDGKAKITAAATQNLCRFNIDLRGLTVTSVKVNDAPATYIRDGRELIITPPRRSARPPASSSRSPTTASRAPRRATRAASSTAGTTPRTAPTRRRRRRAPTPGTRTTTRPNDKASFRFTVTIPADRQVMSNGVLISNTVDEAAGTSTWVWDAPDPMATYLATLQIGKYTIQRGTTVVRASRSSTASGPTS